MGKSVKKRKVAVFDVDGTIFRSSLLIELTEAMIAEGLFPASTRAQYSRAYRDWLNRKDHYDKYVMAVVRVFDKHIKGVAEKDFLPVVKKVVAFHRDRVYRYTRDLAGDLKKKGYFLLIISHSPKYIVSPFAKYLGFDKSYGRYLELGEDGKFTGKTEHQELIFDKSRILMRAMEKNNLTLKGSVGVGDTESDVSFLRLMDKPICFNPNKGLYEAAKKRGWLVVVERKDVIYEFSFKNK